MEKEVKILKFSEMNETEEKGYKNYFRTVMCSKEVGWEMPKDEYDINGLRFSIDYLNTLKQNVIVLPLEMIADYCDKVTKGMIDKDLPRLIKKHFLNDVNIDECFNTLNATAVGNIAYCALMCKNLEAKNLALKQLHTIHGIVYKVILAKQKDNPMFNN